MGKLETVESSEFHAGKNGRLRIGELGGQSLLDTSQLEDQRLRFTQGHLQTPTLYKGVPSDWQQYGRTLTRTHSDV